MISTIPINHKRNSKKNKEKIHSEHRNNMRQALKFRKGFNQWQKILFHKEKLNLKQKCKNYIQIDKRSYLDRNRNKIEVLH